MLSGHLLQFGGCLLLRCVVLELLGGHQFNFVFLDLVQLLEIVRVAWILQVFADVRGGAVVVEILHLLDRGTNSSAYHLRRFACYFTDFIVVVVIISLFLIAVLLVVKHT